MNTELESKLVSYPAPEKTPRTEAFYTNARDIAYVVRSLALIAVFVIEFIWVLDIVAEAVSIGTVETEGITNPFAVILVIVAFSQVGQFVGNYFGKQLKYFYEEVQQGKVTELDTSEKGRKGLKWTVTIKGNNRMNDVRTYTYNVNAADWFKSVNDDGLYNIGTYVDFSKS